MSGIKKYFTRELLYNVIIAIVIIIVLLFIVQSGLHRYTRHNESITVGDLRGMTFEQVKNNLESQNLKWEIMDSIYDNNKAPMSIVDQNPKPNSKVKEGRTIYLTINATNAPTTEIPDLVGRSSFKYAKMQLESYGLKVGEPIYKPDPYLNSVIGVLVNGVPVNKKTKVPRGTVVTLVLGDGLTNSSRISVPYFIGMRLEEAEFKLRGWDLSLGPVIAAEGVIDTASAIIYKQNPPFGDGSSIRIGEPMEFWVAKELPEGVVVDPTLYDLPIDTVGGK